MNAGSIDVAAKPAIAHGFRLQWEPAQNSHVLLYPEGMIKLNRSAGEICKRCDGGLTIAQITADLERAFNTHGLGDDVMTWIELAVANHWLELRA